MQEEVQRWMAKAKRDLATARHSFKSKDYYAASFWSHQATEKALKALQIKTHGKFNKTHDLVFLANLLKLPDELLECCKRLTPVYIETRYPIETEEFVAYSKLESSNDIKLARKVITWIKKQL